MKIPVLENFMFDEPSTWISVMTLVTLISTVYLGFAEMVGNHLEYSKFASSGNKLVAKQGVKISSRTGMLMLYTPAFLAGLVSFFVLPGGDLRLVLLKFAVTVHFFKRDIEVLFVHKYSGNMILDSDEFSVHEMDSILEDSRHDGHRVMFYHFLKPFCDLDNGLEPLASDKDVVLLAKYVVEVAKKLVLDVNESQSSGKDKGQSSGNGQISVKDQEPNVVTLEACQSSAIGKDGSSQVSRQFVNDFYSSYDPYVEHEIEVEHETEVEHEIDGEDETDYVETEVESEDKYEDDTDSQDSDYLVDKDNNVDEVDVDMEEFECNIDETIEFMGCRDRVQPLVNEEEDDEDVEVLDNDYFESASDSDDEGISKDQVKAYIKEHSNDTKREIRMEKNDNEIVRAVCRGVIPSLQLMKT
ncbi:mutator type transposase [Tanacetum coccineum]